MNPNLPLTLTPTLTLSPSVTPRRRDQAPEDSVVKEESSEDESDESDEDEEEEEEEDDDDDSEDSAQDLD